MAIANQHDLGVAVALIGKRHVACLMCLAKMKPQTAYARWLYFRFDKPAVVSSDHLQRQFAVGVANKVWIADITCISVDEDRADASADIFGCSGCSATRSGGIVPATTSRR